MNHSTASARLKKDLMFSMIKRLGEDYCFQCGAKIETVEELSVEHKTPWLHSEDPKGLFFDLDNIAFSHLSCNSAAARKSKSPLSEKERRDAKNRKKRKKRKSIPVETLKKERRERYLRTGK